RGNAFVATADNPSAIYYNPAGIAQSEGQNISLGAYSVLLNSHFNGSGTSLDTKEKFQAVPQLYYTMKCPKTPLAFGLGIYSPYGLSLEWPAATPFAGLAQKGEIEYVTVNPVIAYKICSTLSLAAGATLNYADGELKTATLR